MEFNINTCLGRKKPYTVIADSAPKKYGYKIEYGKDKYVFTQITEQTEFPTIIINIKWGHSEKYDYFKKGILDKYADKIKYTSKWYDLYDKYEVWNIETMQEVVTAFLDALNGTYLECKGCTTQFDNLKDCISHKETCRKLLDPNRIEEEIIKYLKFESRDIDNKMGIVDEEKQIVYLCLDGRFSVIPSPYVNTDDVVLFGPMTEYYQHNIKQYKIQTKEKKHGLRLVEIIGENIPKNIAYTDYLHKKEAQFNFYLNPEQREQENICLLK